jgi:hypothetical protein
MSQRTISAAMVEAMAIELANMPVGKDKAAIHAAILNEIMQQISDLRRLPIKDIAPPLIFSPEEDVE